MTAAIWFSPALESADTEGFDDPGLAEPISERAFHGIQSVLKKLDLDSATPKELRRRILEASVRAAEPWHKDALTEAYSTGDRELGRTSSNGSRIPIRRRN